MPQIGATCLVFTLLLTTAVGSVIAGTQRVILQDITVVDVRAGEVITGRTVVVNAGRIDRIAESSAVIPGENDLVVDGTDLYLMPGLWDMHVHLGEPGLANLGVMVAYGITSVRDMGTPFDIIVAYRESIAAGAAGPRIKAPGMMVTNLMVWKMLQEAIPADMWKDETKRRLKVGTPEEARAAVRRAKNDGTDFIKLHWNATPETYAALGDECRKLGLTFAGHDPLGGLTLEQIAEAGQRSIEHIDGAVLRTLAAADETERKRLYAIIKDGDIHFVPTMVTFMALARLADVNDLEERMAIGLSGEGGSYITPAMAKFWRMFLDMYRQLPPPEMFKPVFGQLAVMHEAGISMMPGTDLAAPLIYPGISLHDELVEFVDTIEMTPAEALRSATMAPAEFFGMADDLGAVEEGMYADLVLLEANPLESISNVRAIHSVVVNGRYIDPENRIAILEAAVVQSD